MPRVSHAAAARHLAAIDPKLAALIEELGPPRLERRSSSAFGALVRAICFQQLSGKAAATIHSRLVAALGGTVTPEAVLARPEAEMRSAGLSAAKTAAIKDLAAKVADGSVVVDGAGRHGDEELVERLMTVRGIGRWTAEMFLIFQLRRLDVWPVDDLGVRKGYAAIYGLPSTPSAKELARLGERFRPYRSVATWYCWRAVEITLPVV